MYILKGFITYPSLTDNDPGKVAPFGEISKDSLTFTRETNLYKKSQYSGVLLYSFESYITTESTIDVPDAIQTIVLRLGRFLFDICLEGRLSPDLYSTFEQIEAEFHNTLYDIELGRMTGSLNRWMPESISFKTKSDDDYVKLWFSDSAFSREYDGYEYFFISPIDHLDSFFKPVNEVLALLAENTFKRIIDKVDQQREQYPYTLLKTEDYWYQDPDNPTQSVNTSWTVLVYGRMGNDPDKIRLALVEWILAHSSYSADEWIKILPGIFTPTEFILVPLWHQFAIPNRTIEAGLNSPLISVDDAIQVAQKFCFGTGYEQNHLMFNTVIANSPYRPITFLAVGSAHNKDALSDFRTLYPDYIGLSVTTHDFSRLSRRTQNWILMFIELLTVAERMTQYSVVPSGYSRVTRNQIVYAVKDFDGMRYLMVARLGAYEVLGIEAPYDPEFDEEAPDSSCSVEVQRIRDHIMYAFNPHEVTKEQIGLPLNVNVPYLTLNKEPFMIQDIEDDITSFITDIIYLDSDYDTRYNNLRALLKRNNIVYNYEIMNFHIYEGRLGELPEINHNWLVHGVTFKEKYFNLISMMEDARIYYNYLSGDIIVDRGTLDELPYIIDHGDGFASYRERFYYLKELVNSRGVSVDMKTGKVTFDSGLLD